MQKTELDPRQTRMTAEEFWRHYDAGMFAGRRVELIGGEIVEMAAQKDFHAFGIGFMRDALEAAFGPSFWVRVQLSLDLSPHSVPDPDLAVVAGSLRSHHQANRTGNNPTTALLVVEVSHTTLRYDRNTKGSLYAASGITDYWILNISDQQLEVYRNPVPDATQPFGYRYDQVTILVAGDVVSPLALPAASIPVADVIV